MKRPLSALLCRGRPASANPERNLRESEERRRRSEGASSTARANAEAHGATCGGIAKNILGRAQGQARAGMLRDPDRCSSAPRPEWPACGRCPGCLASCDGAPGARGH